MPCATSPRAVSSDVIGCGAPPLAMIRYRTPGPRANAITPVRPQSAPRPTITAARSRAGPPPTSIVFSLDGTWNPIVLLSGDQNGYEAFSVPPRALASPVSSDRTQSITTPRREEVNAILQ